jgi:shikimate kinase
MSITVFVLGRPGSGKSTAAHYLNKLLRLQDWSTSHFNDYDILLEMFRADTERKRFRATAHNGFDAIDLNVLDEALVELEKRVQTRIPHTDLVTIEFARDDYRRALRQFSSPFLQDSYFLFLDADIETCLRRVHERVARSRSTDDHPSFSDEIFRRYYARDNKGYMSYALQTDFSLKQPVTLIENSGSLEQFLLNIEHFAQELCRQEKRISPPLLVQATH